MGGFCRRCLFYLSEETSIRFCARRLVRLRRRKPNENSTLHFYFLNTNNITIDILQLGIEMKFISSNVWFAIRRMRWYRWHFNSDTIEREQANLYLKYKEYKEHSSAICERVSLTRVPARRVSFG